MSKRNRTRTSYQHAVEAAAHAHATDTLTTLHDVGRQLKASGMPMPTEAEARTALAELDAQIAALWAEVKAPLPVHPTEEELEALRLATSPEHRVELGARMEVLLTLRAKVAAALPTITALWDQRRPERN